MELTGLVGWRGMVGSVLLERMAAEGDFALIEPRFDDVARPQQHLALELGGARSAPDGGDPLRREPLRPAAAA